MRHSGAVRKGQCYYSQQAFLLLEFAGFKVCSTLMPMESPRMMLVLPFLPDQ